MVPSANSRETPTVMNATFEGDTFDALEVNVPGAHVHLRPHGEGRQVKVHGFVPDCDPNAARELFDHKAIATHQAGDRLYVFGEGLSPDAPGWRERRQRRHAVHLDLRIPKSLNVEVEAPGGGVHAAGLGGLVDLTVMGGTVEMENLSGTVRVHGGGKQLGIHDVDADALDLRWAGGSVTLQQVRSESLSLRSAAAPVTVDGVSGPATIQVRGAPATLHDVLGPCKAHVVGGTLTYSGTPEHETSLRAVGGSLQTRFPATIGARLRLTGKTALLDDAFSFRGEQKPNRVEGTLNGGGPPLDLHAVRGDAQCTAE